VERLWRTIHSCTPVFIYNIFLIIFITENSLDSIFVKCFERGEKVITLKTILEEVIDRKVLFLI
jgi:hypothetical protein